MLAENTSPSEMSWPFTVQAIASSDESC